jgi:chromosome segregation ATPase
MVCHSCYREVEAHRKEAVEARLATQRELEAAVAAQGDKTQAFEQKLSQINRRAMLEAKIRQKQASIQSLRETIRAKQQRAAEMQSLIDQLK